jgi:hypothetical protein
MGKGKDGIQWEDLWTLMCHWHATHDEGDKNFDFAHDIILVAYSHKHYYRENFKKCDMDLDRFECSLEKGHSGQHAILWD